MQSSDPNAYTAKSIRVLTSVDAIRRHPAMFIGGTSSAGLHHLANELIDNAVDEAIAGHAHTIELIVHSDGSLSVSDDGRGIPVEPHPSTGRPAVEVVLTTLHAGAKFGDAAYAVSGGVHGVGLSCVCALAERLDLDVWRGGHRHQQRYERGAPTSDLELLEETDRTGTRIRFWPDADVFEDVRWSYLALEERLAQVAALVRGLSVRLVDERTGQERTWEEQAGLEVLMQRLVGEHELLGPVVQLAGEARGVRVELALQWTADRVGGRRAFTNAVPNPSGGTHLQGLVEGLSAAFRQLGAPGFRPEDLADGLFVVLSVWVAQPQFASQTKTRLASVEAAQAVRELLVEQLPSALGEQRAVVLARLARAVDGRVAATAARRAARLERHEELGTLHGTLADCEHDHELPTEIFLVEGPSAGGSAKQARDRHFQAVLPLRGKVLNAERASLTQVMHNKELAAIVEALGCGVGVQCDPARCRYDRVVIMTDADSDGAHIRTLLLTFFYRDLLPLVQAGRVFVAQPPLFRATLNTQVRYLRDEPAMEAFRARYPEARVQRFKGLGEMTPEQLRESTMDPTSRTLLQVGVGDPGVADRMFRALMGPDPTVRRAMVEAGEG